MSAGRLQLFDKRAGAARPHVAPARPHRRRARAAPARVRHQAGRVGQGAARRRRSAADEAVATLGPEAWPDPPRTSRALLAPHGARPLHAVLRDQRVITGIGRSWVDEILWTARLSPFKRGDDLDADEARGAARGDRRLPRRRDRPLRARSSAADPRQAADAAGGPPPPRRAVPALRHDARGGALRGLRPLLLPAGADRRAACSRTAGSRGCSSSRDARAGDTRPRLHAPRPGRQRPSALRPARPARSSSTSTPRPTRPAARRRPAASATTAPTTRQPARSCSASRPTRSSRSRSSTTSRS